MAYWEYPTNFSNGSSSVNGVFDFFFKYPSQAVSSFYGIGLIILIWSGIFTISIATGSKKAIVVSSFISFIMSMYLFARGLLNPVVPIILIVLVIIGAILTKEDNSL